MQARQSQHHDHRPQPDEPRAHDAQTARFEPVVAKAQAVIGTALPAFVEQPHVMRRVAIVGGIAVCQRRQHGHAVELDYQRLVPGAHDTSRAIRRDRIQQAFVHTHPQVADIDTPVARGRTGDPERALRLVHAAVGDRLVRICQGNGQPIARQQRIGIVLRGQPPGRPGVAPVAKPRRDTGNQRQKKNKKRKVYQASRPAHARGRFVAGRPGPAVMDCRLIVNGANRSQA